MQTPLEIIAGYGAPTNSYLAAIKHFGERESLPKQVCESRIAEIIGAEIAPSLSNEKEANLYFLYTIQETVRAFQGATIPEMADVWDEAQSRAKKFIETHPWTIKEYNNESVDPITNQPKQRKGAKKEQSEELYKEMNDGKNDRVAIIQAFMDQLGMSKAGATTYFHNLKKTFGYAGPVTEKRKREKKAEVPKPKSAAKKAKRSGPSKGELARRIYTEMKGSPKADIVARIVEETGTTPAGANTYYCAAKKEHGE